MGETSLLENIIATIIIIILLIIGIFVLFAKPEPKKKEVDQSG